MTNRLNRRKFLQASSAFAAFNILPSGSQAVSPNGKLRTAHIGVGGMGGYDLNALSTHPHVEIAALCDVDLTRLAAAKELRPHAQTYRDYRDMLSKLGDNIDAVIVSTPDHTHAPATMMALNAGQPVYCQKPLTHDIFEARQLRKVAERSERPTQMGINAQSMAAYRNAVAVIRSGAIGKVSHVYAWCLKNWGYDGGPHQEAAPVPKTFEWDLWLGTAEWRPFVPEVYHPGIWRKLIDFGTGTLGDMGVHIFDPPYAALELTFPKWAKTTCRPPTGIGHPEKNIVEYEFPGTKHTTDSLMWTWYDGAYAPPKNSDLGLPPDIEVPQHGSFIVGDEGQLLLPHIKEAQLFPQEKFRDYQRPNLGNVDHYHQWVDACLGQGQTTASFSYGGPLTEALLLGVVANRFPNTKLTWDAENLEVTNELQANKLLRRQYRDGFEVEHL
ncbi:MAG: Gfo/Idh/MocA family oxidoreductase [Pirellulaceae bacterium]|nr:Gfo/Idh/MocA family oxidoreductase [Pirellulaceae bacterium]